MQILNVCVDTKETMKGRRASEEAEEGIDVWFMSHRWHESRRGGYLSRSDKQEGNRKDKEGTADG